MLRSSPRISSIDVTAENYGYMAPIKASLEANVRYLAKSFSSFSSVRFNWSMPVHSKHLLLGYTWVFKKLSICRKTYLQKKGPMTKELLTPSLLSVMSLLGSTVKECCDGMSSTISKRSGGFRNGN